MPNSTETASPLVVRCGEMIITIEDHDSPLLGSTGTLDIRIDVNGNGELGDRSDYYLVGENLTGEGELHGMPVRAQAFEDLQHELRDIVNSLKAHNISDCEAASQIHAKVRQAFTERA